MNKKQLNKLMKSIRGDAQLAGANYDPEQPGKYCVVGGMAKTIGLKPERVFKGLEDSGIDGLPTGLLEKLCQGYGLEKDEITHLQAVNDAEADTKTRRKKLIEAAKELFKRRILLRQIAELKDRIKADEDRAALLESQVIELR